MEARARRMQISIEDAKSQEAGSWLGVLHLSYLSWSKREKCKDKPQPELSLPTGAYHALLFAQEAHNDYLKAIGAPGAYYEPSFGSSADDEAHAAWCDHAKKKWASIQAAIHEAQMHDRTSNLWAALDYVVLREMAMPHMMASVRSLGNCLSRHFQKGLTK